MSRQGAPFFVALILLLAGIPITDAQPDAPPPVPPAVPPPVQTCETVPVGYEFTQGLVVVANSSDLFAGPKPTSLAEAAARCSGIANCEGFDDTLQLGSFFMLLVDAAGAGLSPCVGFYMNMQLLFTSPPPPAPTIQANAPLRPTVTCLATSFEGYTRLPGLVVLAGVLGAKQTTPALAFPACSGDAACDGFDSNGQPGSELQLVARTSPCAGTFIKTDRLGLYAAWIPPSPPFDAGLPPAKPAPRPRLWDAPLTPGASGDNTPVAAPPPAVVPPASASGLAGWVIGILVAAVVVAVGALIYAVVWWRRRQRAALAQLVATGRDDGGSSGKKPRRQQQLQQPYLLSSGGSGVPDGSTVALDLTAAGSAKPLLMFSDPSYNIASLPSSSNLPSGSSRCVPGSSGSGGGGGGGSGGGDVLWEGGAADGPWHAQPASLMNIGGAEDDDDLNAHSAMISDNIMRRMLPPAAPPEGADGDAAERSSANNPELMRVQLMRQHSRLKDDQLQLFDLLGRGGSGTVYRASWKGLPVAAKIMVLHEESKERTQRQMMEATMSTGLFHPNIVTTYVCDIKCLGQSDATVPMPRRRVADKTWQMTILQELCLGGTLRQLINSTDLVLHAACGDAALRTRVAHILQLSHDIALALEHLHSKSIVHSDLTPANVLLQTASGAVTRYAGLKWAAKVADFGLSILIDEGRSHASHVFAGTPHYIAPETQEHGMISRQSDVFTFGILMYELIAGSDDVLACGKSTMPAGAAARLLHGAASPPGGDTPGPVLLDPSDSSQAVQNATSASTSAPDMECSQQTTTSSSSAAAPAGALQFSQQGQYSSGSSTTAVAVGSPDVGPGIVVEVHEPDPNLLMSQHKPALRGGGQGRRGTTNVLPPLPCCCPPGLRMLVRRCLAQAPEARPTVAQVRQSLTNLLDSHMKAV